jgi:hypothetical protein
VSGRQIPRADLRQLCLQLLNREAATQMGQHMQEEGMEEAGMEGG